MATAKTKPSLKCIFQINIALERATGIKFILKSDDEHGNQELVTITWLIQTPHAAWYIRSVCCVPCFIQWWREAVFEIPVGELKEIYISYLTYYRLGYEKIVLGEEVLSKKERTILCVLETFFKSFGHQNVQFVALVFRSSVESLRWQCTYHIPEFHIAAD